MQKIIFIFAFFAFSYTSNCQSRFKNTPAATENNNGLIYADSDITALRFVVDSLNLKFKTCSLNKDYLTYPQTKAYAIRFKSRSNSLEQIKKDIQDNASFTDLALKYKNYIDKADTSLIIVALPEGEDGELKYLSGNANDGFESAYNITNRKISGLKKWVYTYTGKEHDNDAYTIDCIYFPSSLSWNIIPAEYARLIQYVDCMIDTATNIYLAGKSEYIYSGWTENNNTAYSELNQYVNNKMQLSKTDSTYDYDYISPIKTDYIKKQLSKDPYVIEKVHALVKWASDSLDSGDDIEELAAFFISPRQALQLKRSRRVMGGCSQDRSPIIHAMNIAVLAAQSHSWDVFLRAHLDIMNDRFERAIDGSYAWEARQTYIRELEVLDINVIDMMIGLCLRAYNNAANHYNGTVWRIGKALSESKDRELFETKAMVMMKDDRLDEFNRSLIFLLYNSYLVRLTDKKEAAAKITALQNSAGEYPSFISNAIKKMDKQK
ncbi:MAG: hypothetical protein QM791_18610 [Ferruginibacter sp.]